MALSTSVASHPKKSHDAVAGFCPEIVVEITLRKLKAVCCIEHKAGQRPFVQLSHRTSPVENNDEGAYFRHFGTDCSSIRADYRLIFGQMRHVQLPQSLSCAIRLTGDTVTIAVKVAPINQAAHDRLGASPLRRAVAQLGIGIDA